MEGRTSIWIELSCLLIVVQHTFASSPLELVRNDLNEAHGGNDEHQVPAQVSLLPNLRRRLQVPVTSMLLGDSWAAFALLAYGTPSAPANYCADVSITHTVINRGVSSSTAAQWFAGSCFGLGDCNLDGVDFSGVDNVWVTLGGNDFLGNGCANVAGIANSLKSIIITISAKNNATKVLLTSYGVPSTSLGGGCNLNGFSSTLNSMDDVLQSLDAELDRVTYVPVMELFGGSLSPPGFSSGSLYADSIHLNQAGYDTFYNAADIKAFFCSPDCTAPSASPTVYCQAGSGSSAAPNPPTAFFENPQNIYIVAGSSACGLVAIVVVVLLLRNSFRRLPAKYGEQKAVAL